jgi:phosphoenolpyruvate synthase/pyruvate phosphate dikinase
MSNQTIFAFPGTLSAPLTEVGGKGLSLMQGSQAGLPVPPGFILSVSFFLPWFQELQATKAWSEFIRPNQYDLEKSCHALKQHAFTLSLTKHQEQELAEALQKYPKDIVFAVRSSSPEEDLEGASFAGGYETVLGVTTTTIEQAIKQAFASCLDYRVTVYKHEHGFALTDPKIAIIVQEQIPSEIAGVGFSLNPVTNNYDEAVFTANWGLGETVVQGIATPDTYTVDKLLLHITHKQLGTKETSMWLLPDGGTTEERDTRHQQLTLSDDQVRELTTLLKNVENLYQKPIDMEWAFANDKLYLLQARPITGYVPLSPDMVTNPGKRKRLYLDLTISVQGITHPVSIMATSFFTDLLKIVGHTFFNRDVSRNINTTPAVVNHGRIFINLSVLLRLLGRKRVLSFVHLFDPLAEKALSAIELNEYTAKVRKSTLVPWKLSLRLPTLAIRILKARQNPMRMHTKTQKELQQFVTEVKFLAQQSIPTRTLADKLIQALINHVFLKTVPLFITAISVHSELKQLAGQENKEVFDQLDKALPNNITTEMGLALFRVSQALPPNLTQEQLVAGLHTNSLPEPFLLAWKEFLQRYGFRGPEEIDLAAPRYQENPTLLLAIVLTLQQAQENTQEQFENNQRKRKQAYETLYQKLFSHHPRQAQHFAKLYQIYETFAGYREAHKYYVALAVDLLRQRILQEAKLLYEAKRLDSVNQIFDLTLEQLDTGRKDTSLDLKALAKNNRLFLDRLAKIPSLPTLIDSRGLIIKPPAQTAKKGESIGLPVSPGLAQGKVKILHTPSEKPFFKGEILVARATDPGWTPLFVNASAVILEVGGMLQHGALVAREYGLPCVTGVENATTLWQDGTLVEVDGSQGIIRMIANETS